MEMNVYGLVKEDCKFTFTTLRPQWNVCTCAYEEMINVCAFQNDNPVGSEVINIEFARAKWKRLIKAGYAPDLNQADSSQPGG